MPKKPSKSGSYEVGYGRPPEQYKFKSGQIPNPTGINKKSVPSPDVKASLERELTKPIRIKRGKQTLVLTQEAAGISEMVRRYVKGEARARRDLFQLCEEHGINLSNRAALQDTLDEVLSADDEALLADYFRRHRGRYCERCNPDNGKNLSPSAALKPNDSSEDPS
jgi:Family of unknown function (DUF5681)